MPKSDIGVWMPHHIGDFREEISSFSVTEIGGYTLLLMHCWQNGGYVPNEYADLKKISGLSMQKLEKIMKGFLADDYGIYHPRLKSEYDKWLAKHRQKQQQTEAARRKVGLNRKSVTEPVTDIVTHAPLPSPSPPPEPSSLSEYQGEIGGMGERSVA